MKFRSLFDLMQDAQDVTSPFEKVETKEQLVSTLERLKRTGTEEFLNSLHALRLSSEAMMEDLLELGSGGDLEEKDELDGEDLGEGEDLLGNLRDENTIPAPEPAPPENKS